MAPQVEGLAVGVIAALRSVDGSPLLDRLIRGRGWIVLVAFALIGIVTLQLTLLKLNAGIGRALAQETTLERQNSALSIENSERAAGNLVESSAASSLGMQLAPADALRFLTARPGSDAERAATALKTPVTATSTATAPSTAGTGEEATSAVSGPESSSTETTQSQSTSAEAGASSGTSGEAPSGETASSSSTAAPSSATGEQPAAESSSGAVSGASPSQAPATPAGGTQAQSGPAG